MSRVKNFPEKIHTAFTKQGEHVILSDNASAILTVLGHRVQLYTVPKPLRKPCRALRSIIRHQEEPDAPEAENKPRWKCPNCGLPKIGTPLWKEKTEGHHKEKFLCPKCARVLIKNE